MKSSVSDSLTNVNDIQILQLFFAAIPGMHLRFVTKTALKTQKVDLKKD